MLRRIAAGEFSKRQNTTEPRPATAGGANFSAKNLRRMASRAEFMVAFGLPADTDQPRQPDRVRGK
jgi:hypothetical protein